MQEFFKSTIISKYIKYLLSYTPLPLYPMIEHNQFMIEGITYIYKHRVLLCTKSGIFSSMHEYYQDLVPLCASNEISVQDDTKIKDYITVYNKLTDSYKKSPLVVTNSLCYINNVVFAEYEVINDFVFGEEIIGVTQKYVANTPYYDSTTHRFLGEYLRLIRNQFNLDLMPLYNCYDGEVVNNITLDTKTNYVGTGTNSSKKVLLVPIKFNTTYTVAYDCETPITVKAVVYKGHLTKDITSGEVISNSLSDICTQVNNSQFIKPFTFKVDNEDANLQQYETHLYMALQVPYNNYSTLTVIEGDLTLVTQRFVTDIKILETKDNTRFGKYMIGSPSLLQINDGKQHPFSDKLLSYLLRNTMDDREYIDENVANVETKINYSPLYKGMWDINLRYILYHRYMEAAKNKELNGTDILGFVDIDIEDAVRKGYIKYAK